MADAPPSHRRNRDNPPSHVTELLEIHCLRAGGSWDYFVNASDEAVTLWHGAGSTHQRAWPRRTINLTTLAEWLSRAGRLGL